MSSEQWFSHTSTSHHAAYYMGPFTTDPQDCFSQIPNLSPSEIEVPSFLWPPRINAPDSNIPGTNSSTHQLLNLPKPDVVHLFTLGPNLTLQCKCGKTFSTIPKAREHAYGHLEEKPYKCSCGQTFGSKTAANRHCNSQEKRFVCEKCYKKFKRADHCREHEERCFDV